MFSSTCFVIFLKLVIAFVLCIYDTHFPPAFPMEQKLLHSGPAAAQLYSWPFTFSAPGDSWAVALVTGVQVSLFLGLCPRFGNVHRLGIFREGIFLPLSCVIGGLAEDTVLGGGQFPLPCVSRLLVWGS